MDALLGAYSNSLLKMNLTSLTLFCVPLTPSLLSNIREVSHIRYLALQSCAFGQVSTMNVQSLMSALRLEELEVTGRASWEKYSGKNRFDIMEAFL